MINRVLPLLSVFLLALFSHSAFGHKLKSAYSIVLFNERTGYLEVMHRTALHDAEEASAELFRGNADIIEDSHTQGKLARYVTMKFQLKGPDNQTIPLSLVGFQNDAGYFWVYQDYQFSEIPASLAVHQTAFMEVWREQINIVNIEYQGKTKTLTFAGNDAWQSTKLD